METEHAQALGVCDKYEKIRDRPAQAEFNYSASDAGCPGFFDVGFPFACSERLIAS